jgi:hypothetical protein
VSEDCRVRQVRRVRTGTMALMGWTAVLVLLGLLVQAVRLAHRGLPDPKAPLVRRVPREYRGYLGSRGHRDHLVQPATQEFRAPWALRDHPGYRDRRAGRGTTSK